ncbi:hypothetical protein RXV95_08230 [Novosphingobium sp. ZN18A2]|uniref:hypothetical protein n=1 Tax=Novosphingobium sp. ZN18A2 TaxID=3079861 RepID=UPI0030D48357
MLPTDLRKLPVLVAGLALAFASGPSGAQEAAPPPMGPDGKPPAGSVGGMGDINIYPKRVVIDGRQRIATIGLYNKTANTGEYETRIVDMAMSNDGQVTNLDKVQDADLKAKVQTASAMLRWSPRRVMLQGNEAQTIHVMARTRPGMAPGEYRSHFVVVSVPPADETSFSIDNALGKVDNKSVGVRIIPRFGISIPVIVRIGETTLKSGLKDVSFTPNDDGGGTIDLVITREGTRSSFGDLIVTAPGSNEPVALLKGVGVYPEIDWRKVSIPVRPEIREQRLKPGMRLTVTYVDDDVNPGQTLAKQDFVVP